ncbi:MAG: hypothetical protein RIR69_758 [Actinomycetota bacterium]
MHSPGGPPDLMKVAAIQYDIAWNNRDTNFRHVTSLLRSAKSAGVDFAVLPEMFSTGFVVDSQESGEPIGGPSSQFLIDMASDLSMWIAGSCPEYDTDDPRPYNSLVIASPEREVFRYRKIHPFTYGGEDRHYRAGNSFLTVPINGLRVSFFVCYDLRFADEFWNLAHQTDLYVIPANWPTSRREHWLALLTARAIENQAFVLGCNRIGTGGGLDYSGESRIIDPLGKTIGHGTSQEMILTADISAQTVIDVRKKFPFLADRR